jgi:hypothetical protein
MEFGTTTTAAESSCETWSRNGDAFETSNVCVDPIRPRLCAFLVNWYAEHPKSDPPPALEVPPSPEAPTAAERLASLGHMVAMMAQAGSTVIMCE